MKKFYKSRCQHAENDKRLCEKCQIPKDSYRLTLNQQLLHEFVDFETRERPIQQQIDASLSNSEILELRFSNEENLIYELTNRNFFHLNRAIERYLAMNRQ